MLKFEHKFLDADGVFTLTEFLGTRSRERNFEGIKIGKKQTGLNQYILTGTNFHEKKVSGF